MITIQKCMHINLYLYVTIAIDNGTLTLIVLIFYILSPLKTIVKTQYIWLKKSKLNDYPQVSKFFKKIKIWIEKSKIQPFYTQ